MMQGSAALSQDLPPFCVMTGLNQLCGLNVIGLRRNGFAAAERTELKRAYHRLFRGTENWRDAAHAIEAASPGAAVRQVLAFLQTSKRGFCRHGGGTVRDE